MLTCPTGKSGSSRRPWRMPSAMEISDASCRPGIGIRSNSRNSVSTLSTGARRAASTMGSATWTCGA